MRFIMVVRLILVMSLSVIASTASAQGPARNLPAPPPPAQVQQPTGNPPGPGQRLFGPGIFGPGAATPGVLGRGPLGGFQSVTVRGQKTGGPLQRVSRLLAALDDPRVRTMLGLTDQQADSLRKIVVDTETFTIKTGAVIAVDSIDLREQLRADKPDRAAVMGKGNEISKSTSDLISHYLDAMLAAKAILTPEQQKMIRAYMDMERDAPVTIQALPSPGPPAR